MQCEGCDVVNEIGDPMKTSQIGFLLSALIHIFVFSVPIGFTIKNVYSPPEKVLLLFEPPKPEQERERIEHELEPITQQIDFFSARPRMEIKQTMSAPPIAPIESEVVGPSGIDIPVGRVYEAPYSPPHPATPTENMSIHLSFPILALPMPEMNPVEPESYRHYFKTIKEIIERNKEYPQIAKSRGLEGTVQMAFTLHKNGSVGEIMVKRSSGEKTLDDGAILSIKKSSPFPPVPELLKGKAPLRMDVTIVYKLGRISK
jgi:TonB family protein